MICRELSSCQTEFSKISTSDSTPDRSAAVVEKETLKEALSELLAEMLGFKALMGEAGIASSAGPSSSREASHGSVTG